MALSCLSERFDFLLGRVFLNQMQPLPAIDIPLVPRSSSIHRRHHFGPLGDLTNQRVRMSNLLAKNMAVFLTLLLRVRSVWFVIEQPASSWLFKIPFMLALSAVASCRKIHTWKLASVCLKFLRVSCAFAQFYYSCVVQFVHVC